MAWYWWTLVAVVGFLPVAFIVSLLLFLVFVLLRAIVPKGLLQRYFINLLIAFDQLANAIRGGDPDQTISGAMGRAVQRGPEGCRACYGISKLVCRLLDVPDPDHCGKALRADPKEGKKGLAWRG